MAGEWGMNLHGKVYVDSSAAIGVVRRKGNGKLRHIRVGMLWVQEKQETGELQYQKVLGSENPGDMMTKYLPGKAIEKHMLMLGFVSLTGRARKSLRL